jgi:hypothetical protein
VLKSPIHLESLPTLFAEYPDARVIVTHRDPLRVLASLTSLVAVLRHAHGDAVDYPALAAVHARRYRRTFDALVDWTEQGRLPAGQLHHLRYADLVGDPGAAVRGLCARFDRPLDEPRLAAALADPRGPEPGGHAYRFDDLGLDPTAERAHYRRYQRTFDVPSEEGTG